MGTYATQIKAARSRRRVKAQVLADCQVPGASVAAVALAHGLNVNLVREWLVGRGIMRAGLAAPRTVSRTPPATAEPYAASLQFIPVELTTAAAATAEVPAPDALGIHIELADGGTQLSVRWPSTEAASCAAWLGELAVALKE